MADNDGACAACGRKAEHLLRCARCKSVWYCGAECQRASWGGHKKACRSPSAPPAHAPPGQCVSPPTPDVSDALSGGEVLAIGTCTPGRLLILEPASGQVLHPSHAERGTLEGSFRVSVSGKGCV